MSDPLDVPPVPLRRNTTAPDPARAPDLFKQHKLALRHAIVAAHRDLSDGNWVELDDTVFDGVTTWLGELEKRRRPR